MQREQVINEIRTVGLLPQGGDDNYLDGVCECCGKREEVIQWEGVEVIAQLCDHCFVELNQ